MKSLRALIAEATKLPVKWDGSDLWHVGDGYESESDPHRYTGIQYDSED